MWITNGPRLRGGLGGRMAVRGNVITIKPSNMISSTDSQLKIAATRAVVLILITAFALTSVFSALSFPKEARAAATISKSLSRPINEIGLVGWWTMDGPDMLTNVADRSGQGNNGSLSHGGSGTTTAPGRVGQALSFDGTDDYVSIGDPANGSLDFGTGSFSYGMWVHVTQNVGSWDMPWFKGGSDAPAAGYDFELGNSAWVANIADETVLKSKNFSSTPILNRWVHLMAVVDRTANQLCTYVDGAVTGACTDITGFGSVSNATAAVIGSSSDWFRGTIDDVRVYNRALSATEVLQLYNLGR